MYKIVEFTHAVNGKIGTLKGKIVERIKNSNRVYIRITENLDRVLTTDVYRKGGVVIVDCSCIKDPEVLHREKVVASYLKNKIEQIGGKIDKIKGEGVNGLPDYLIAYEGRLYLVETKRPHGGRISPIQRWQHKQYAKRRVQVWNIKNKAEVDSFIKTIYFETGE